MKLQYRIQYDEERDEIEGAIAADLTTPTGDSLTQQQYKDATDINVLMGRMGVTDGALPPAQFNQNATVIDYTHLAGVDLKTIMERTRSAEEAFRQLPANIRAKFRNKPEEMWEFVNNPNNDEESLRLGLLQKPEEKKKEEDKK